MKNNFKNQSGGFLQIIILIIIALFVMKYLGVSISDIINWFKITFGSVLK